MARDRSKYTEELETCFHLQVTYRQRHLARNTLDHSLMVFVPVPSDSQQAERNVKVTN